MPSRTPRPSTGSWKIVNAFPELTFGEPVQMLPVPGSDELMVVEKEGRLIAFVNHPATWQKRVVLDVRAQVESSLDSGMLGLAFHPEFGQPGSPNRNYLFVYYRFTPDRNESDRAYCRLSRFTYDEATGTASPDSELVLINQYDRNNWHCGGGLLFGPDGFLYLSIGDEGGINDFYQVAQRIDRGLFSGILRIDVNQDPAKGHPIRRQPRNEEEPPPGWPASFTQGYFIPDDNPWVAEDGSQLEEFYAVGLRNPHRMTLDPVTGELWVGDVGQSTEEEVSRIVRGGNYQWPYMEGSVPGPRDKPTELLGFDVPPTHSYGRGSGICVIGGYVYRGSDFPELEGKYLFGDLGSEQIWTLEMSPGGTEVKTLMDLSTDPQIFDFGLSSFGIDASGELYLLILGGRGYGDGKVYRMEKATESYPEPPSLLSQTGAFTNLATLEAAPGVIPYEVNQPLWSDGAAKRRWIVIPNDGHPDSVDEQIIWSEEGSWTFPTGTVLIKHFEFPGRRLETRFMVLGEDGSWFGFTYRWREDGSDAELLPSEPLEETIIVDGVPRTWHFPGRGECASCHNEASGRVLGVKTRQWNREVVDPVSGLSANQLVTFNRLGFFAGGLDEEILPDLLTSRNQSENTASLERRARSYLDANCSHCHQPGTLTRAVFDARLSTPPWSQNLLSVEPYNDFGIPGARLVDPGHPERSTLIHRVGSLAPGVSMPPVAKHLVDEAGMQLLTDWIRSLDPAIGPTGEVDGSHDHDSRAPRITMNRVIGSDGIDGSFQVALTASEPIFGMQADDFDVTNGSVSGLSGEGSEWSFRLTPDGSGSGSVTLPSDRVTDGNGNANELASLSFVAGPNLLVNGDFETGTLVSWETGGSDVTAVSHLQNGFSAARLGSNAFIVQTLAVSPGSALKLTGQSRNLGSNFAPRIAAISFWKETGEWLAEAETQLGPGSQFEMFTVDSAVPANASIASVVVWSGTDGTLEVDDLRLVDDSDTSGEPPFPSGSSTEMVRRLTLMRLKSSRTLDLSAGGTHRVSTELAELFNISGPLVSRGFQAEGGAARASSSPGSLIDAFDGPATIVFQWYLDRGQTGDQWRLLIDEIPRATWQNSDRPVTMALPIGEPGFHTLEFEFLANTGSPASAEIRHLQVLPFSPEAKPDLAIGLSPSRLDGIALQDPTGRQQMLRFRFLGRRGVSARINWRNLSPLHADAADLNLSVPWRDIRFEVREVGYSSEQITAQLKSRRYQCPLAAASRGANYHVRILPRRNRFPARSMASLRAKSVISPAQSDAVRILVKNR